MKDGARLAITVIPRAKHEGIEAEPDGGIKVRVTAPPAEGAANRRVIELLARRLGVPKSRLQIVRGESSRHKIVCVQGADEKELRDRLDRALADDR